MERALNDKSISLTTLWQDLDDLPDADDIRDLLATLQGHCFHKGDCASHTIE
jgi:hypothetical protein